MLFKFIILAMLGLLAYADASVTKTYQACVTKQGPSSQSTIPRTTYTKTITLTATRTVTTTPKTTVTITGPTIITTTATITETTTTTPTTTVPTPPGFTPINPGAAKKRTPLRVERDDIPLQARAAGGTLKAEGGRVTCSPPTYPQTVICGKLIKVIVTTTITNTASTTKTVTSVVSPNPTKVTTTTVTSTSKVTETAPASTVYAACIGNTNRINAYQVGYLSGSPDFTDSLNANDCCVECQQDPTCIGSVFSTACINVRLDSGTCPANPRPVYNVRSGNELVLSNGPCGGFQRG